MWLGLAGHALLLAFSLTSPYYAGPSPATTGVLKLEPSDAARSGNMLRIAQAELPQTLTLPLTLTLTLTLALTLTLILILTLTLTLTLPRRRWT